MDRRKAALLNQLKDTILVVLGTDVGEPRPISSSASSSSLGIIDNCWKWTIPAIVEDADEGLSEVAVETLSKCLQPVLDCLGSLDAEVLLELQRLRAGEHGGAVLLDGVFIRPIHDNVEPEPFDKGAVRYLHLSEMEGRYSMGIFVFPPHARIPLHDHPGMCVLSRILYGDIHRLQLDLCREQVHTQQQRSSDPSSSSSSAENDEPPHRHVGSGISNFFRRKVTPPDQSLKQSISPTTTVSSGHSQKPVPPVSGAKRAFKRQVDHLQAPQTTILFPFEGNLHEFVAGPNGAAVLDVLLPPYDVHQHRDCTFYEIYDDEGEDSMVTDDDHETQDRTPCWIVPTGQPEEFHCISGQYRNVGTGSS